MLRSQVGLYKIQHNDTYPESATSSFLDCLTQKTDVTGDTVADGAAAADAIYGPYMQHVPTNPFNDLNTIRVDGAAAGADTDAWRFDTTTGAIQADDTLLNADGVAHTAL